MLERGFRPLKGLLIDILLSLNMQNVSSQKLKGGSMPLTPPNSRLLSSELRALLEATYVSYHFFRSSGQEA